MKNLILILKGILLYSTIFVTILVICSIDSIVEQSKYALIFQNIILIILCIICISKQDLEILTLTKWQKKLLDDKDDE